MIERIKEKCNEKGLKISQLEKELGFGNATIRRWGENAPSVDKALKVANFLNISLEWLVTGKEAPELTPEERELLQNYRKADERGKRRIRSAAAEEAQEQISSASKIG